MCHGSFSGCAPSARKGGQTGLGRGGVSLIELLWAELNQTPGFPEGEQRKQILQFGFFFFFNAQCCESLIQID